MIINTDSISQKTKELIKDASASKIELVTKSTRLGKIIILTVIFIGVVTGSILSILGIPARGLWTMVFFFFLAFLAILEQERVKLDILRMSVNPDVINEIRAEYSKYG